MFGVESGPTTKDMLEFQPPVAQNVILFGNKVFTEVNKLQ